MHLIGKYKPAGSMSELIAENYRVLLVMSRFGISLGFGDKTIAEVCEENKVDVDTFLAVVNMLLDEEGAAGTPPAPFSIAALLEYLHYSHDYFLAFRLPAIRQQLQEALNNKQSELNIAIINYFDEYIAEVRKHMLYEEDTVFPYVRSLLEGRHSGSYSIDVFSRQHDQVEARLGEFKNILLKYYPAKSTNELNNVLFDIFNCEHDLASHNAVEDRLFIPAIRALEHKGKR